MSVVLSEERPEIARLVRVLNSIASSAVDGLNSVEAGDGVGLLRALTNLSCATDDAWPKVGSLPRVRHEVIEAMFCAWEDAGLLPRVAMLVAYSADKE